MSNPITVKQASDVLGIGLSRVYGLVAAGELQAVSTRPLMLDKFDVDLAALKHRAYARKTVSAAQAAEQLGVARWTLYGWVNQGKLKAAQSDPLRFTPGEINRVRGQKLLTNVALAKEAEGMGLTGDIRILRRWLADERVYPRKRGRANSWPARALEVLQARANRDFGHTDQSSAA